MKEQTAVYPDRPNALIVVCVSLFSAIAGPHALVNQPLRVEPKFQVTNKSPRENVIGGAHGVAISLKYG